MKFTEVLEQLNIPCAPEGHHHAREGWIQIDCPFCAKDAHQWHMGYPLEGKTLNCWRCGTHPLIKTLMESSGVSYQEIKKLIGDIEPSKPKREKHQGKLIIPKGVKELAKPHLQYLKKRKFDPSELQKTWKIKGISISTKLAWRIFIPVIYHGKTVSWTTRSISDNTVRYISASPRDESVPLKHLLYGEDYADKSIIITEGVFDVWRIGAGAVAVFGTNYSYEQILKMTKYKKRIICFDNEKEAQQRAKKLCNDLSAFKGNTYNVLLDSNDPDSASTKELLKLRRML